MGRAGMFGFPHAWVRVCQATHPPSSVLVSLPPCGQIGIAFYCLMIRKTSASLLNASVRTS